GPGRAGGRRADGLAPARRSDRPGPAGRNDQHEPWAAGSRRGHDALPHCRPAGGDRRGERGRAARSRLQPRRRLARGSGAGARLRAEADPQSRRGGRRRAGRRRVALRALPPDPQSARAAARSGQPFRLLALSGGSLHGAFGAGFLDGWRRSSPGERLPEFDVVTGISTGSILSTFAFLGNTERGVTRYAISNESELLTPIGRNRRDGSMSPFELVRVVRRGAVADL